MSERERLEIRYQLADTLLARGEFEAAEAIHAEVLTQRQALFGDGDLDTASSQMAHGHELWRDGDIGDAEAIFTQVLSTRQEILGDRHELVTDTLTTLGSLYYSQGMMAEAARFHRAAAEQAEETYGERSIRLAIALSNLAHVETDPAESEALFNRSLAIRQEILGPEHALVIRAEQILAGFYAAQGEPERAEPLYRQSIRKAALSQEDPQLLGWSQNSFARFLEREGRYDEAISMYSESRSSFARQLGDGHRWTLVVHGNLAGAYHLAGDHVTALEVVSAAVDAARSAEAPSELAIADLQRTLADISMELGRLADADEAISAAIEFYERNADLYRRSLTAALSGYTEVLFLRGRTEEALAVAERVTAIRGDANEGSWYLALLTAAILADSEECAAARSLISEHGAALTETGYTAPRWQRLKSYVESATQRCVE